MKIVISSSGPDLDAAVDPRFGRAAYFIIADSENGELLESIDNSSGMDAAQGAGITAAAMVADKGVGAILTGRLGPKAMAVVEKTKIKVISNVSGTVREAVEQFRADSRGGAVSSGTDKGPETTVADTDKRPGQGMGPGGGGGQGRGQCGGGGGAGKGRGLCKRG